jgi:hypothetical protein
MACSARAANVSRSACPRHACGRACRAGVDQDGGLDGRDGVSARMELPVGKPPVPGLCGGAVKAGPTRARAALGGEAGRGRPCRRARRSRRPGRAPERCRVKGVEWRMSMERRGCGPERVSARKARAPPGRLPPPAPVWCVCDVAPAWGPQGAPALSPPRRRPPSWGTLAEGFVLSRHAPQGAAVRPTAHARPAACRTGAVKTAAGATVRKEPATARPERRPA